MRGAFALAVLAALACATGGRAGTAAGAVPPHVVTAAYVSEGDDGFRGPARAIAPYVTWATDPSSSNALTYQAAGMQIYAYANPNRAYARDDGIAYRDLRQTHPSAIARTCAGTPVTASGGALLSDPRSAEYLAHLRDLIAEKRASTRARWDAYFLDDTASIVQSDAVPCGFAIGAWIDATVSAYRAAGVPIIFNGLSDATYGYDLLPIADEPEVIGAMWEGCYAFGSGFGTRDAPRSMAHGWARVENDELALSAKRKAFWCLSTSRADPASVDGRRQRMYAYASFLLAYDPRDVYQSLFPTVSRDNVMPETALVPTRPLVPPSASVLAYRDAGGAYGREYEACYLRAAPIGPCAVVVNPDDGEHPNPYPRYARAIALEGSGILEGGTVRIVAAAPRTLAPVSAAILLRGAIP